MILFTHSTWINLVISLGYMWLCYMFIYCIVDPTFLHLPSLFLYIHILAIVVSN
jgi:hypothetical protein